MVFHKFTPMNNATNDQITSINAALGLAPMAAAEQAKRYQSFGPAYVGTGIAGDLSVEAGITTGDGDNCQRSGIGIYLRSDHMAHRYTKDLLI